MAGTLMNNRLKASVIYDNEGIDWEEARGDGRIEGLN